MKLAELPLWESPCTAYFAGRWERSTNIWETGKLVLLESEEDVHEKLRLVRRTRTFSCKATQQATLDVVINHISAILENRG